MDGTSVELVLRVKYDTKTRRIKLFGSRLTASSVSNDPASDRYHPNLYAKLANVLRNAGAPAPAIENADA